MLEVVGELAEQVQFHC